MRRHRLVADSEVKRGGYRDRRDGKYVTSAGVSASIDAGLFLADLIAGEMVAKAIQLGIEYYPAPPFPERSPQEAPAAVLEIIRAFEAGGRELLMAQSPSFSGTFPVVDPGGS